MNKNCLCFVCEKIFSKITYLEKERKNWIFLIPPPLNNFDNFEMKFYSP